MSDRIDELVAEAEFLNDNGCDKCEIVTRLAIIAREAEAERDALLAENEYLAQQNLALTLQLAGSDMPPIKTFLSTTTTPRG